MLTADYDVLESGFQFPVRDPRHVIHRTHQSIILRIGAGGGGRDSVGIDRCGIPGRREYERVAVSEKTDILKRRSEVGCNIPHASPSFVILLSKIYNPPPQIKPRRTNIIEQH